MNCIDLTEDEKVLLDRVDFNPRSSEKHDVADWNAVGGAARALMKSLIARKAIPEVRTKYFTDADFNVSETGRSRADIFEKNGPHAFPRLTEPFNSQEDHATQQAWGFTITILEVEDLRVGQIAFTSGSITLQIASYGAVQLTKIIEHVAFAEKMGSAVVVQFDGAKERYRPCQRERRTAGFLFDAYRKWVMD